jgi:HAD superfamily hydrolase (TIGR01662 family)
VIPGCVLLDWGDTLMVDFPDFTGPMATWPRVEAVAHAREALEELAARGWQLALATNAADSVETDIRAALGRVSLDSLIDRVYCSRAVGHRKPSPEFFGFIGRDLGLPASRLVMVGDNYEVDVLGANSAGIRAVWLHSGNGPKLDGDMRWVIGDMDELPELLESLA